VTLNALRPRKLQRSEFCRECFRAGTQSRIRFVPAYEAPRHGVLSFFLLGETPSKVLSPKATFGCSHRSGCVQRSRRSRSAAGLRGSGVSFFEPLTVA